VTDRRRFKLTHYLTEADHAFYVAAY